MIREMKKALPVSRKRLIARFVIYFTVTFTFAYLPLCA
jgi:hypothetical protein